MSGTPDPAPTPANDPGPASDRGKITPAESTPPGSASDRREASAGSAGDRGEASAGSARDRGKASAGSARDGVEAAAGSRTGRGGTAPVAEGRGASGGALTGRRGLATTAVACAIGAGLVLLAATRGWQDLLTTQPAPLPPVTEHRTGAEIAPWLPALGVVALAGAGALFATRAAARLVVGALLILSGVGIAVAALVALGDHVKVAWPLLCALAGLLVLAAGVITTRKGRSWPGMGARYERPAAPVGVKRDRPASQAELWDALDRGEDPTNGDRP
ncbi:Trp biosynthesis-associated membrane protein [Dactylosporangium sp. NPDC051485]|uniref:Trp biosynthesis-associated membrane protein n=1 Tax=Dactylosporangium sp. NPDC051485 TaxID=3154846 RepID=UPI0034465AE1